MILFDRFTILIYGLFLGICGLPLAFYLFRKEKEYGLFEKIIFGYMTGITLMPLLFVFELIVGLKYQTILIYINWIAVFLFGLILNLKEIIKNQINFLDYFKSIKISKINLEDFLTKVLVGSFIFAIFWIGYNASGIPIMDLDPYFYLDGVRQVVYDGYNYFDDKTAWYPLSISSHVGNPIWKYSLASWFSLYNQHRPYDPYVLIAVGSVFPPIIGALAVFFAYLLFKELYDRKTAVLIAGAIAFAPIMLVKFQGGDFQIEPYNILAFLFSIYGLVYFLKREFAIETLSLLAISLISLYLGSNIGPFLGMFFALVILILAVLNYIYPQKWLKLDKLLFFIGLIAIILVILFFYYNASKIKLIENLITITKFFIPYFIGILVYYGFNHTKILRKNKDNYTKSGVLILLFFVGVLIFFVLIQINEIKNYILSYLGAGGYTVPLVRTIAEQSPGPSSYAQSLGFFGEDYAITQKKQNMIGTGFEIDRTPNLVQDSSLISQLHNYRIMWFNIFSYPSIIIDTISYIFSEFGNLIAGQNTYQYIPKNNSFFSLVTFFALLFSILDTIYKIKKEKRFDLDSVITLTLLPILIVSFGKQKFVMYCALIGIIYLGISFGVGMRFFEEMLERYKKEKLKYWTIAIFDVVGIIAIIANPSLLVVGLFVLSLGSILILLFYDYFIEKRELVFWAIVLLLVACEFFGPYLLSFEIFNLDSSKPNSFFQIIIRTYGLNSYALFINSFTPRIYDNINRVLPLMIEECNKVNNPNDPICYAVGQISLKNYSNLNPFYYYNGGMCSRSLFVQDKKNTIDKQISYLYRCSMVDYYWLEVMEWISKNTPKDARIISWWDYGHWINFFGQRNAVLRNEQASLEMIGQTAAAFLHKDLNFLKQTMKDFGSEYAFFDVQIVGVGNDKQDVQLGGKYHALNYLGCAWQNETNVSFYPGESRCEREHLWEQVLIPKDTQKCIVSEQKNITGLIGYRMDYSKLIKREEAKPVYCFIEEYTQEGAVIKAYMLNEKDIDGDLKIKKAEWKAYNTDNGILLIAFYTKFPQWKEKDGKITDGWGDRTTKYYDSNLYSAFFFDTLDGFELVYNSPQIRIFKLKE